MQVCFGSDCPLLALAAAGDAIEIELSGGGQELHLKDVELRASVAHHGQSTLLDSAPSAPAPPQGAPGGPVQLGTLRAGPGQWDPSNGLSCSSQPPPKSSISPPLTLQVAIHSLPELLSSIDVELRRALLKRAAPQEPPHPDLPLWEAAGFEAQPPPRARPASAPRQRSPRTPH